MNTDELERLRAVLEVGWPGFAAQREQVEIDGAAPAIASLWKVVGWAPALDAWPDPRSVDHEAQLAEWIAEARLEYEQFDDDEDEDVDDVDDDGEDPDAIETAFPITREQLPARARVLRRSDEGGDFTLWIADEDRGDEDPRVLELSLRPTWAGSPPLGLDDFTRTLPRRAAGFIAAQLIHDLGDRRAITVAVAITHPHGEAPLPTLVPEFLELAPRVWLERGHLAGGSKPDRLSADSFAALLDWARAGGAQAITACSAPLGGVSIAVPGGWASVDSLIEDPIDLVGHRLGTLGGVAVWIAPTDRGGARIHVAERDRATVEAAL